MKTLLILIFPLLLLARLLNELFSRDPLRLHQPREQSFWIERAGEPDRASYFSEMSVAEGKGQNGLGALARVPLQWLARLFAPRRSAQPGKFLAAADREQGIPDEIYTLW